MKPAADRIAGWRLTRDSDSRLPALIGGLLIFVPSLGALVGYVFFRGPFLWGYEVTHAYLWWPAIHLTCACLGLAVLAWGAGWLGHDPTSAGPREIVAATALLGLLQIGLTVLFFARSWSFVPLPMIVLASIPVAVCAGVVLWMAVLMTPVVPQIRRLANLVVLSLMTPALDGKDPSRTENLAWLAEPEGQVPVGTWRRRLGVAASYLHGLSRYVLRWLSRGVRRRFGGDLDEYVARKNRALIFRCPSDHFLHVLQCRARNALAAFEPAWHRVKWAWIRRGKAEPRDVGELMHSFDALSLAWRQYETYASMYRRRSSKTSRHLFSLPWMPGVVQACLILERLYIIERLCLFRKEFQPELPLPVDLSSSRDEAFQRLSSIDWPDSVPASVTGLIDALRTPPGEDPESLLKQVNQLTRVTIPWDRLRLPRGQVFERWDIYALQLKPDYYPDRAETMALVWLARLGLPLRLVHLARQSPAFAMRFGVEREAQLQRDIPAHGHGRSIFGSEYQRVLADLLTTVAVKKHAHWKQLGYILRGLLREAEDRYFLAGAAADHAEAARLDFAPPTSTVGAGSLGATGS